MTFSMSQKELDRYGLIRRCIQKRITESATATLLRLSLRHVQRLKRAVRAHGPVGLIHGNRGKPSNRRIVEKERTRIVTFLHQKICHGFTPTFAAEKLKERCRIDRDPKTIRAIMIAEGLWKPARGKNRSEHRAWRQRRSHVGELIQFDGSYHHWLEDRGGTGELCLIAAIDDASGRIMHTVFGVNEGVFDVFAFWKGYVERLGKPRAVYCDKFSTYKQHIPSAADQDRKTQFQRAMESLTIEPIFAESPEAKGRVERLFGTLQDRLVKELRLARITTVAEANRFLAETFIPQFNAQFAVESTSKEDLHRSLTTKERKSLNSVFARHDQRTVANDFTIAHHTQWYQLTEHQPVTVFPKNRITVEEWLDHSIHLRLRGKELMYAVLPARPKKTAKLIPWVLTTATPEPSVPRLWKPAADHPWRRHAVLALTEKEQKTRHF